DLDLEPLYRVDAATDLDERTLPDWPGYNGEQPVRIGNAAAHQKQNDVFGEMVLALAPVFLDDRFSEERSPETLDLLQRLARKAIALAGKPDEGIWEFRSSPTPQTFSSVMSWAAADRTATVLERRRAGSGAEFRAAADRIRQEVLERSWSERLGSLVSIYGGDALHPAKLAGATVRLPPPGAPQ